MRRSRAAVLGDRVGKGIPQVSAGAADDDRVMDRLLFVDDEPFVLRALKRTFELWALSILAAGLVRENLV